MRKGLLSPLLLGGLVGAPLQAQEATDNAAVEQIVRDDERLPEITVTATGSALDLNQTGQPVTLIGREEIEAVQGADITRVLSRAPGVGFSRNGSPGSFTAVRVRGAEAEQLLVLVDGVRVADPAAPGGGFDFGNLLAGNIAKIDLLRSSNSTVWGSDAIGGVLAVTTREDSGLAASAEHGARDTTDANISAGIRGKNSFLGGSASWYRTDGFSSALHGTERDGFEQWAANAQGRVTLAPRLTAFANARYVAGDLDLDGYPPPAFTLADTTETQRTRQYSGSAGVRFGGDGLALSGTYSFADTHRRMFDPLAGVAPTFASNGRTDRFELRGAWRSPGAFVVDLGGDYERTHYVTSSDLAAQTHSTGAYLQAGIETTRISAHLGGRRDNYAGFGGATSVGADVSYEVASNLHARASFGEGFKAPTLFQWFSDYGNKALRPERSSSFDVSLALGDRNHLPYASVAMFRRDSRDQIDFVSCFARTQAICAGRPFGTYDNVGRTRAQGLELEAGAELGRGITARLAYSYLEARNRTLGSPEHGNRLARRPRQTLSLGGEWRTANDGPTLGADLRWVSRSFDDAANDVPLPAYAVLDVMARCPLGERIELYGRIENLWDERYQTAAGYASPPRGAFVGARWRL